MPLYLIRDDITRFSGDAIVNAANETLLGGGGVDGAIHRAAGPQLLEECKTLHGCRTGDAKITKGYDLPTRYVIHTVGPIWRGGGHGEAEQLASCYRNSLELAQNYDCKTVAFPLISSGIYGYPKAEALQIAVQTITAFLLDHDMSVSLVVFDHKAFQISEKLFADVKAYIDANYVDLHTDHSRRLLQQMPRMADCMSAPELLEDLNTACPFDLEEALSNLDESFSQMLLRKIDERGMTDPECYKKANIDRKLFAKIRKNALYKPSKPTVLAFAVALELSLDETKELLRKAGYALSHSNRFDVIVEYFILRKEYDVFRINEVLFAFDQVLLGMN